MRFSLAPDRYLRLAYLRAQRQRGSELDEYLNVARQRRRIYPRAALVGLLAGLVAGFFRMLLTAAAELRGDLVAWGHAHGWAVVFVPLATGAAAGTAVWLARRFAPEAAGSGIPHLKAVLLRLQPLRAGRLLVVKLVGSVLAIGSGMALGREGPTVQMGGAVGSAVADRLGSPTRERLTLTAAGAGAGLAAAFNAPLAGLVFVLEEIQRDFRPVVFGAAFVASAAATVVSRLLSGPNPVFAVPTYPAVSIGALPGFVVLGVLAGLLGAVYNKTLLASSARIGQMTRRTAVAVAFAAAVGALVGGVALVAPFAVGNGHGLAEAVLGGQIALAAVPLWLAGRFVLTMLSYGTGAPGGIFAPLLVLGALLGLAVGYGTHAVAPTLVPHVGVFAVVGMAALFTAIVRAPLTGIVLILEMTADYSQMLPLLVSGFFAFVVVEALRVPPIYEALLERSLHGRAPTESLREPTVLEVEVQPHAPFAGQTVAMLGLPPGVILVRVTDGAETFVPTAQTRLAPHMRLTVVVAPGSEAGADRLYHGCGIAPEPLLPD